MRLLSLLTLPLLLLATVARAADVGPALKEGEKLYYEGQFDEAARILAGATADATDPEQKLRAFTTLGMVKVAQGDTNGAESAFRSAVELAPSRKLSPKTFPPQVIHLYNAVRARSVGSVSIQTTPSDAKISIDGKPVGLTPVVIDDLLVGPHPIVIEKEGYRREERTLVGRPSERGVFHLELVTADDVAPVVEHAPPLEAIEGRSARIRASATDNHGVAGALLSWRVAGGTSFAETPMEQVEAGVYEGVIPRTEVTPVGIEYYLAVTDVAGNVTNDGDADHPHLLRVAELDKEPPHIFHTPLLATSDASTMIIRAQVKDNKGLAQVRIGYKREGDANYIVEAMQDETGAGDYLTVMPALFLEAEKILYYLEAADQAGNIQYVGRPDAPNPVSVLKVSPVKDGYIIDRTLDKDGDPTKEVVVNVGAMKGVTKGQIFTVFSAADQVTDPETGTVLAVNQRLTGRIRVTVPGPASSRAQIISEDRKFPVEKGNLIRYRPGPPVRVGGVSVKFRENTVTWAMSPEPEVEGYIVYRSDSPDGPFEEFDRVRGRERTETVDEGTYRKRLEDGRKYYYQVRAINDDRVESELSKVGYVVAKGGPNPPTGLTAAPGQMRKIPLSWSKSDDRETAGYQILRADKADGEYTEIGRNGYAGSTSFTDEADSPKGHSLADGTTYWYKVVSFNDEGKYGNPTEPVSASTMGRPAPPTGLAVVSMGVRSVSLTWDLAPDPTIQSYRVYRNDAPEGTFALLKEIRDRGETEFTDSDKSGERTGDGVAYYYRLTSVNAGGVESDFSEPVTGVTLGPPAPPGGLTAVAGQVKQAALAWIPSPDPETVGYVVYRGTDPENLTEIKKIRDPLATSYTDTGSWTERLGDGTVYYYQIRSFNSVDVPSTGGKPVSVMTKPTPTAPTALAASGGEPKQVTLTWSKNAEKDITGYRVFRSERADGGFALVASGVTETRFIDGNLKSGWSYFYTVQAVDADGLIGAESAVAQGSTKPAPTAPTGLTGTPSGADLVTLTWSPNPEGDISHYEVWSGGFFAKKLGEARGTSYMAQKLSAGTSYTFQIVAVDRSGLASEKSTAVSVATTK
ncbi:MAG: fibronectin type III domain-containing protein [Nitrospinae bacterium]|nr:fibronectin type III domain-containing protein [Nitrospinota bacterium]